MRYILVLPGPNFNLYNANCLKLKKFSLPPVPDAPTSFTVSEVYSDGLRVSWGEPAQLNGILVEYILKYWRNSSSASAARTVSVSNETLSYVVTGLSPNTLYSVQVAAKTRVGLGSAKQLDVRTVSSPGEWSRDGHVRRVTAAHFPRCFWLVVCCQGDHSIVRSQSC